MKCNNYPNHCIYYHESHNQNRNPTTLEKYFCDRREDEEFKNMTEEERNDCSYFKSYKNIKIKI